VSKDELNVDSPVYPKHVGIIMDGNGRWATKRGLPRTAGHYEGIKAAKRVTTEASRLGIPFLTYYVFSTENWRRPDQEVSYLMDLFSSRIFSEIDYYKRIDARLLCRGNLQALSRNAQEAIAATVDATASHQRITVTLALNYGGQDEIVRSVNRWLSSRKEASVITEQDIRDFSDLPHVPPVDLIVRAGGEKRLSNFLLWDSAYAELAFYDTLWPDWGAKDLRIACEEYAHRTRRFGGVPT
jgi:undecaprenyl diphosphate synthase